MSIGFIPILIVVSSLFASAALADDGPKYEKGR